MDFVILDFEPDPEVPFILVCPVLATEGSLIDVAVRCLTICTHNKAEVCDVYQALKLVAMYEDLVTIILFNAEATVHQLKPRTL